MVTGSVLVENTCPPQWDLIASPMSTAHWHEVEMFTLRLQMVAEQEHMCAADPRSTIFDGPIEYKRYARFDEL